ncbi:histone-fold-containing protein [Metschnikowia bicuspidata var. bicuspidata NRRL YB-4993]|uniref:Histone-fold-containing protein n=1 Tax=Metschnikowia bicuspidata var. bicuspidata NRRL YB-4993 TaxID=869754 RepID=A0A1A0H693_9ASCO|nr:histone-fold-containing protein [Metschnikowia bicuspidata var. bicuspidata NRRL YB-4993]OBA19427.1 histone-fold-containing protein [Metschnikowia bicuspidata var. bicuspidata NRRL YB-4993]
MSYLPIGKDDGNHNVVGNPDMELREQDRWLPIANVARLMKLTLPMTAKVSKDAKECMQECVSEFISFITSEASDKCLREKRKTINGEDVLYSLHDLGFENYAEVLKIYLAKYREQQALKQERGEVRVSKKLAKKRKAAEETPDSDGNMDESSAPLDLLAYSESSAKALHSPDYFQPYELEVSGIPAPSYNTVDIKHDIDLHHDVAIEDKHAEEPYQYEGFIPGQNDAIAKDPHENGLKPEGIETISRLAGQDSDMEHLDDEIPQRAYY